MFFCCFALVGLEARSWPSRAQGQLFLITSTIMTLLLLLFFFADASDWAGDYAHRDFKGDRRWRFLLFLCCHRGRPGPSSPSRVNDCSEWGGARLARFLVQGRCLSDALAAWFCKTV